MTIGRHAFVGAGSVVARDVPDHVLVHGVPVVLEGWMCECGVLLAASGTEREAFLCAACGLRYRKSGEGSG